MGRREQKIKSLFPTAQFDAVVAPHTSFGLGGKAFAVLEVQTPTELVAVVKSARANSLPYVIIAGGSNVVLPDKPIKGLVIVFRQLILRESCRVTSTKRGAKLDHAQICHCQGVTLTVDACLPLAVLIKSAIKNNLAGLESLSGIPGTVGGAIVGNAGAYGQSVSDKLVEVEVFVPTSQTLGVKGVLTPSVRIRPVWLSKKACKFAYRDSIFKHKELIVLRAKFELEKGDGQKLDKKSREIIKTRNQKYAPGLKCPGSFFKNVLVKNVPRTVLGEMLKLVDSEKIRDGKIPAGYLLESVGARGMRVGDIYVADFHGNLLVNGGSGTCADVKKLATKLKQKVFKKFGIMLEEEVRYIV